MPSRYTLPREIRKFDESMIPALAENFRMLMAYLNKISATVTTLEDVALNGTLTIDAGSIEGGLNVIITASGIEAILDALPGSSIDWSFVENVSIVPSDFSSSVDPIQIVSSLPADNSDGNVVFLTTDNKLYRWTGSGWTRETDGSDITAGTITGDKIAAGEIGAAHIEVTSLAAIQANTGSLTVSGTLTISGSGALVMGNGTTENQVGLDTGNIGVVWFKDKDVSGPGYVGVLGDATVRLGGTYAGSSERCELRFNPSGTNFILSVASTSSSDSWITVGNSGALKIGGTTSTATWTFDKSTSRLTSLGGLTLGASLNMQDNAIYNVGNAIRAYHTSTDTTDVSPSSLGAWTTWSATNITVTDPGVPVRVLAWVSASAWINANRDVNSKAWVQVVIGGTGVGDGMTEFPDNTIMQSVSASGVRSFDPSGNFTVSARVMGTAGGSETASDFRFREATLTVLVIPQ